MKGFKYEYATFQQSPKRKDTYDLIDNDSFPFYFIKCSEPKADYLIKNNTIKVIQSWKKGQRSKILHTGLIHVEGGFCFGDNINQDGKKDFIIVRFLFQKHQILFWLFKNKNPKNKTKFTERFISYLTSSRNEHY